MSMESELRMITSLHAQMSDIIVDVYTHHPLDDTQEPTYEMRFLDIPSGSTHTISFPHENDCVLCFAAWICADDPTVMPKYIKMLQGLIPEMLHKYFLP